MTLAYTPCSAGQIQYWHVQRQFAQAWFMYQQHKSLSPRNAAVLSVTWLPFWAGHTHEQSGVDWELTCPRQKLSPSEHSKKKTGSLPFIFTNIHPYKASDAFMLSSRPFLPAPGLTMHFESKSTIVSRWRIRIKNQHLLNRTPLFQPVNHVLWYSENAGGFFWLITEMPFHCLVKKAFQRAKRLLCSTEGHAL